MVKIVDKVAPRPTYVDRTITNTCGLLLRDTTFSSQVITAAASLSRQILSQ